jgi:hypothetical protein
MTDDATLTELNTRIAAIRENIRELIEQAAAYSGVQTKSARQIGSQIRKPSSQRFSKSGMLCWVNRTNLNSSGRRLRSAGAEAAHPSRAREVANLPTEAHAMLADLRSMLETDWNDERPELTFFCQGGDGRAYQVTPEHVGVWRCGLVAVVRRQCRSQPQGR